MALSRDERRASETLGGEVEVHAWADPTAGPPPAAALAGADAVVNLMGEEIAQRWTEEAKRRIRDSRVLGTRSLVEGMLALERRQRPPTLVSQSAVGYYGPAGDEQLDEQAPAGSDFLAKIVVEWEREALSASPASRVAVTRTGVVLASAGGALAKMLPFFRLGLGGPVAGGRQYVPWIHLDDVVGGLLYCVDNGEADGPVNLTAPTPATNAELSRALGTGATPARLCPRSVIRRPASVRRDGRGRDHRTAGDPGTAPGARLQVPLRPARERPRRRAVRPRSLSRGWSGRACDGRWRRGSPFAV